MEFFHATDKKNREIFITDAIKVWICSVESSRKVCRLANVQVSHRSLASLVPIFSFSWNYVLFESLNSFLKSQIESAFDIAISTFVLTFVLSLLNI